MKHNPRFIFSFALNGLSFFAVGVFFCLPWLFTNEEILQNFEKFWGLK